MNTFVEHRLISLRASDFDDKTRYNSRTAGANAQLQQDAHQQALQQNQQAGTVVERSAADVRNQQLQGPLVNPDGTPTAAGIFNQQQANVGSQTTSYDTTTGQVTQKPQAAPGYVDTSTLVRGDGKTTGTGYETQAEFEQRKAAVEQQNYYRMQQEQLMKQSQGQSPASSLPSPQPSAPGNNAQPSTLEGLPENLQKAYEPAIAAQEGIAARAQDELIGTKQDLQQQRSEAVTQMGNDEESALQGFQQQLDFNKQTDDLARQREEEIQRQQLAANDNQQSMLKVEQARAEQLQRDQNIQSELENRRTAAKLGINYDSGGLQWMQEQVRKGNDTLSYLIQRGAIASKDVADQRYSIIEGYRLDMKQLDLQAKADYASAYGSYLSEKKSIRSDFSAGEKDRATQLKEARQRYYDTLKEVDTKVGDYYKDARLKMWDQENELSKAERAKDLELLKRDSDREWQLFMAQQSQQFQMGQQERSQNFQLSQNTMNRMIQFKDKLNDNIRMDPAIKDYREIQSYYQNLQSAVKSAETEYNWTAVGQTAVNMFNKMMDNQSVVRESEYARTAEDIPLWNRIKGYIQQKGVGGPGLTQDDFQALSRMATKFNEEYTARARQAAGGYIMQMDGYNSLVPPEFKASPAEFLPKELQFTPQKSIDILDHYDMNPGSPTGELQSVNLGTRRVTGDSGMVAALQQADAEFFAATGQHLDVNSSFRSEQQQRDAYGRYLRGEIARAAPPGKSLHEKGIAVDITNWKEAEPFLIKYGFHPLPKDIRSSDPAHFSFRTVG